MTTKQTTHDTSVKTQVEQGLEETFHIPSLSKYTCLINIVRVELLNCVLHQTSSKVPEKQDIWIECDLMRLVFDNIHTQDNQQVCFWTRQHDSSISTWMKQHHHLEYSQQFSNPLTSTGVCEVFEGKLHVIWMLLWIFQLVFWRMGIVHMDWEELPTSTHLQICRMSIIQTPLEELWYFEWLERLYHHLCLGLLIV